MKQVYEAILVATLILSTYLVISTGKNFSAIQQNIISSKEGVTLLQKQLSEQQELIVSLQTEFATFHKDTKARVSKAEKFKADIALLKGALSKVYLADVLRQQNKLDEAAKALLSAKEPIWLAGDSFSSEQTILRGLMWPIDKIVEKWKEGSSKADTAKISATITKVLNTITP